MMERNFVYEHWTSLGVLKEFLLDACLEKENLFRAMTKRGRHTYQMLLLFVENFAMSFEDAIRLFAE
jgi:hypothetical protein